MIRSITHRIQELHFLEKTGIPRLDDESGKRGMEPALAILQALDENEVEFVAIDPEPLLEHGTLRRAIADTSA